MNKRLGTITYDKTNYVFQRGDLVHQMSGYGVPEFQCVMLDENRMYVTSIKDWYPNWVARLIVKYILWRNP